MAFESTFGMSSHKSSPPGRWRVSAAITAASQSCPSSDHHDLRSSASASRTGEEEVCATGVCKAMSYFRTIVPLLGAIVKRNRPGGPNADESYIILFLL